MLFSSRKNQDQQITRLYKNAMINVIDNTFRNIGFEPIAMKINVEQTFRQLSFSTDAKAI
ncbi:hypothetical protein [Acidocella sp. C78]|uniref:hypothetical protein n=1 Tax=Acidocella sp. C78 TaxID=1671486 RepID=UPI00191B9D27|nr:hypothetical protein [Acidocella sp. C78]